jgi:hypothetical protein
MEEGPLHVVVLKYNSSTYIYKSSDLSVSFGKYTIKECMELNLATPADYEDYMVNLDSLVSKTIIIDCVFKNK